MKLVFISVSLVFASLYSFPVIGTTENQVRPVYCYVITSFIYVMLMKNDLPLPLFWHHELYFCDRNLSNLQGPVYIEIGDPR